MRERSAWHRELARRSEEVKRYVQGCAGMYVEYDSSPEIRIAKGDTGSVATAQ